MIKVEQLILKYLHVLKEKNADIISCEIISDTCLAINLGEN